MGAKDIKSKEYMSVNDRFADIFNYCLFDGEEIIKPEDLREMDPDEVLSVYGISREEQQKQKWRDLLKSCVVKSVSDVVLVLLGLENQSEIHYAMPVKCMVYDALNYGNQVAEAARKSQGKGYRNSAEFLSGFRKDDRITPVITLTLYWGADEWDGPLCLSDMFYPVDHVFKQYLNDYQIHLVAPCNIKDFSKFRTELRFVLEFIKASRSGTEMRRIMEENEMFRYLGSEAVTIIKMFTGIDVSEEEEGSRVDLCKAWVDQRIEDQMNILRSLLNDKCITKERAALEMKMTVPELEQKFSELGMEVAIEEDTVMSCQPGKDGDDGRLSVLKSLLKKHYITREQAAMELNITLSELEQKLSGF